MELEERDPAELNGLKMQVESLVFVSDGAIEIESLARALEQETEIVEQALAALAQEYQTRGFRLQRTRDRVQLVSAPEAAPFIQKFLGLDTGARLSPAALETLAIIAYQQPITRPQIEAIRGVNCDGVVRTLVSRGLIEECGTEPESTAHLYRTTTLFLEKLGLDSVEQLPPLAPFLPDDVEALADAGA